jgi:hypothetical protein
MWDASHCTTEQMTDDSMDEVKLRGIMEGDRISENMHAALCIKVM